MLKYGVDSALMFDWFVCLTVSMVTTSKKAGLGKNLFLQIGFKSLLLFTWVYLNNDYAYTSLKECKLHDTNIHLV